MLEVCCTIDACCALCEFREVGWHFRRFHVSLAKTHSSNIEAPFDHVDREAQWHHLKHVIGVPPQLLTVIQNMYSGVAYRLVDGLSSICPFKGFK
jgi:hypothetical protein